MRRTWAERTVRAVVLGVRWDVVPPVARAAVACLTARQWDVLCWRLNGESCESIGERQGCSKQAIHIVERAALCKLAQLAGRALPCSVNDFIHATREAPSGANVEYTDPMNGRSGRGSKTALDKLADEFIAEAERGPVSAARREWYDRQARQLETQQLAE